MSNEDYHSRISISSTQLKLGLINAKALFHRANFKQERTQAMLLGTLVHELVLEPEKAVYENWVSHKPIEGKVSHEDWKKAKKIDENVSLIFGDLFTGGLAERSFFAEYGNLEGDIIEIRCRPDYLKIHEKTIIDLKTIDNINHWNIKKAIETYHYDLSAGFYVLVLSLLGIKIDHFQLIFGETTIPHRVIIYEFSPERLKENIRKCQKILDEQLEFIKTGVCKIQPIII